MEPCDFSVQELEKIFLLAEEIMERPKDFSHVCEGKLLATLFYEPSTRTRFSFEAAMLRLGGKVIGFSDPNASSTAKGESIADTIRTVGCYVDIVAMRHPKEGIPKLASQYAQVPVINAGDGGNQHPTQTLTDLFTIKSLKGRLAKHTIGFCGDLKFGRTVHSLVQALLRYEDIKFVFISPPELKIPESMKEALENHQYYETTSLEEVINDLDILYMTRVQRERFSDEAMYLRLKDQYILTSQKLSNGKKNMMIMHPLPRVNEIDTEVDNDPRAVYFQQARFGMFARMALIMELLGINKNV